LDSATAVLVQDTDRAALATVDLDQVLGTAASDQAIMAQESASAWVDTEVRVTMATRLVRLIQAITVQRPHIVQRPLTVQHQFIALHRRTDPQLAIKVQVVTADVTRALFKLESGVRRCTKINYRISIDLDVLNLGCFRHGKSITDRFN